MCPVLTLLCGTANLNELSVPNLTFFPLPLNHCSIQDVGKDSWGHPGLLPPRGSHHLMRHMLLWHTLQRLGRILGVWERWCCAGECWIALSESGKELTVVWDTCMLWVGQG